MTNTDTDPALHTVTGEQIAIRTDTGQVAIRIGGVDVAHVTPNVALGVADALEQAAHQR